MTTKSFEEQIQTQLERGNKRRKSISSQVSANGSLINPETTTNISTTTTTTITAIITATTTETTALGNHPALSEDEKATVFPAVGQTTGSKTAPTPTISLPDTTTTTRPIKLSKIHSLVDDKLDKNTTVEKVTVKGSLKKHLDFWLKINSNQYVIDVIENGYKLPLITNPDTCHLKNNKSSLENSKFVEKAIQELLDSGSVIETSSKPYVINPLTVAKNKDKCRLVLDLRHVNLHLWKDHIVFEDWKVALDYYSKDCYMFDFDLKSGYHHIDINQNHQKYLGFAWKFGNKERYFKFTVLPFGLATAGHVFTKVLKCLVKHWREKAIRIIMFLDDGFGVEENFETATINSKIVKQDLEDSGLIANQQKSHWVPQKQLTWLGVSINSGLGILHIPEVKVKNILQLIDKMLNNKVTSARRLASLTGKIISTSIVLGSVTNMMLRHCHRSIVSRLSWDSYFKLDEQSTEELRFWKANFENLNVRKLNEIQMVNRIVYSDASAVGAGGYVVDIQGAQHFKQWEPGEDTKSSTWRELKGVYICLTSFSEILENKVVRWFTDNRGVVSIVKNGSMKQDLHLLAIDIYKFCIRKNISLKVDWVPRDENTIADKISRSLDTDDWEINGKMFSYLDSLWGAFTVDLFADENNHKTQRFYSRHWVEKSTGVDAFSFSWSYENCWIVPPVKLIAKVLKKLMFDKAKGTLVIPKWPSSAFWPILTDRQGQFLWCVKDYLIFTDCRKLLKGGRNCKIFKEDFKGAFLVLKIDASW